RLRASDTGRLVAWCLLCTPHSSVWNARPLASGLYGSTDHLHLLDRQRMLRSRTYVANTVERCLSVCSVGAISAVMSSARFGSTLRGLRQTTLGSPFFVSAIRSKLNACVLALANTLQPP